MNLNTFFKAKKIAVIGASRKKGKVGNTILKQLSGKGFTLYPINPKANKILGKKSYSNVLEVPGKIELAVIATPAPTVPSILEQCGKKEIRHVIIISAGFKEVGNKKLEKQLQTALKKTGIKCIGPNGLGIYDAHSKIDTLFLPEERLRRAKKGGISFITQSGALGSAILDLAAYHNYGFAKFISYGNAANVDESDLLEYLAKDAQTKVICLYVEGIKDGKKFLRTAKTCRKPIIVIKGGKTEEGSKAAISHTGSLAGEAAVYEGAFRQAGCVIANTLEELFEYAKIISTAKKPKGPRVHIITDGGGYGILAVDAVKKNGLKLALLGSNLRQLRKKLPETVILSNPADVLGDATTERYKLVLNAIVKDKQNDSILLIGLTQVPRLDERIVDVIAKTQRKTSKPIIVVLTGSEYTQNLKKKLESKGPCTFTFPENAVRALAALTFSK